MKRRTAKLIHEAVNLAFWIENPDWRTGNTIADLAMSGIRKLPVGVHEPLKRAFYNTNKVVAVSGESVVAANDTTVDKFMFRYPGKMSTEKFKAHVTEQVATVTTMLGGIALPTSVSVKSADVFRRPNTNVDAVTQTQSKLDLAVHGELDIIAVTHELSSASKDRTAKDIDTLLAGTMTLVKGYGYYPDLALKSGNLRRNIIDGAVTLIDVMPFYADGTG